MNPATSRSYATAKETPQAEADRLPYTLTLKLSDGYESSPIAEKKVSYAAALALKPVSSTNIKAPSSAAPPSALPFTVASYNIGGRMGLNRSHYDRASAAAMAKVMENRIQKEKKAPNINDLMTIKNVQELRLKILFSSPEGMDEAEREWNGRSYNQDPRWYFKNSRRDRNQKAVTEYGSLIGPYMGETREFAVVEDRDVQKALSYLPSREDEMCKVQIRRIFSDSLRKDIICIQEANWIDHESFAGSEYDSIFTRGSPLEVESTQPPKTGIAWNRNRFAFVKVIESVAKRAIAIQLRDKTNDKIVFVASAHISGCNPFYQNEQVAKPRRIRTDTVPSEVEVKATEVALSSLALAPEVVQEKDPGNGAVDDEDSTDRQASQGGQKIYDSTKGDLELIDLLEKLDRECSDVIVIGMDLNVTSLHPRMMYLKRFEYQLDYTNHLYPTSTNPKSCLDTRIDWIVVKKRGDSAVSVVNLPVDGVKLNDVTTNVSDHRPIASQVIY